MDGLQEQTRFISYSRSSWFSRGKKEYTGELNETGILIGHSGGGGEREGMEWMSECLLRSLSMCQLEKA